MTRSGAKWPREKCPFEFSPTSKSAFVTAFTAADVAGSRIALASLMPHEPQSSAPRIPIGTDPLSNSHLTDVERHFAELISSVDDHAIFLIDPNGIVLSWNAGAKRIKGYEPHEIIGKSFTNFYTSDAIEARWPQRRTSTRRGARPVSRRRLANSQGWHANLGQYRAKCLKK